MRRSCCTFCSSRIVTFSKEVALIVNIYSDNIAFADLALNDEVSNIVNHLALNKTLQRTCSEHRIKTIERERLNGGWCHLKNNTLAGKTLTHISKLDINDLLDIFEPKCMEYHDIIYTVEEFRLEGLTQSVVNLPLHFFRIAGGVCTCNELTTNIAGHYDDRVLEAHNTALTIGKTSIIQYLGVGDLMYNNGIVVTATYNPLPCYYISAIIYLTLNIVLGKGLDLFERRMKCSDR